MRKNPLPLAAAAPAVEKARDRVVNPNHIVLEDLSEYFAPGAFTSRGADIQQVAPLHSGRRLAPRGRGQQVSEAPVKALALEHALPVIQPERLKAPDVASTLRAWTPDLGVVAAYGKFLPPQILIKGVCFGLFFCWGSAEYSIRFRADVRWSWLGVRLRWSENKGADVNIERSFLPTSQ